MPLCDAPVAAEWRRAGGGFWLGPVGELAAQRSFPWLVISGVRFNTLGVVAAELAAISFAFYNVYGQHLLQIYQRWTVLVYSLLGAAVFWQIVNPPWKVIAQHYSGGPHSGLADVSTARQAAEEAGWDD